MLAQLCSVHHKLPCDISSFGDCTQHHTAAHSCEATPTGTRHRLTALASSLAVLVCSKCSSWPKPFVVVQCASHAVAASHSSPLQCTRHRCMHTAQEACTQSRCTHPSQCAAEMAAGTCKHNLLPSLCSVCLCELAECNSHSQQHSQHSSDALSVHGVSTVPIHAHAAVCINMAAV